MKNWKKREIIGILVVALFIVNTNLLSTSNTDSIGPYFTLVCKYSGGGVRGDYFNLLKQQLNLIGIQLEIISQDWPSFVGEIIAYHDYDIVYIALSGGGADPDFTGVYNENGSMNLFGYHTSMDYNETLGTGLNEWYMREGTKIIPPNSQERIDHYWAWEQHLMDNILPCLPTFAPRVYTANWANLQGYNSTDRLLHSWGKMSWDGTHEGQLSTEEVVITDAAWSDLNPIFQDDCSSSFISSATMDTLVYYDSDISVWPHLATGWTYLDDTNMRVFLREGVKWQPDRDGNFTDEYFDAEDVYFTIQAMKTVTSDCADFGWIREMVIIDDYTIDFFIDGDESTQENEPDTNSLSDLSTRILPEHYLNQTQLADGVTPDITHPSWNIFATHCFGTGLFTIDNFEEDVETILTLNPDCWRLNTTLTSDPNLNWVQRFGDFSANPTQLRIRIIPDTQTALLEFKAGRTDLEGITQFREDREEMIVDPDFDVQWDTQFYLGFFGFNLRPNRPVIGNTDSTPGDASITVGLAVRKAICYAANLEEINNVVHSGDYAITYHPIYTKLGIWCNPNIIKYKHNRVLAQEYMNLIFVSEPSGVAGSNWYYYSLSVLIGTLGILFIVRKKSTRK